MPRYPATVAPTSVCPGRPRSRKRQGQSQDGSQRPAPPNFRPFPIFDRHGDELHERSRPFFFGKQAHAAGTKVNSKGICVADACAPVFP